jgi:hypothetical protein
MGDIKLRDKLRKFVKSPFNLGYVITFIALIVVYFYGITSEKFSYIAIGGLLLFIAIENFAQRIGIFEDIKRPFTV